MKFINKMAAIPDAMRGAIEKRYYSGPEAYTSAMTVYRALRDDPTVDPKPTIKQVNAVLRQQSVAQTMQPLPRTHRATYDSIVAKRRAFGERRHQLQFDIVDWHLQKNHNRIGAAAFRYGFLFVDVYSRHAVLWPGTRKDAQALLSAFVKASAYFGGPPENITLDGEAGATGSLVKQWAIQNNVRLWINRKPERGPSNTFLVERLIRTLRSVLAKRWRANGNRVWAIPEDQATNPATADQIRNNQRPDTPIMQVLNGYNARTHSTLKASPNSVYFLDVTPEYIKNAAKHGVCRDGPNCSPGARAGIRKRDTAALGFRPGLVVRLVKKIRSLAKKTDTKVLTAGLWRIIHVAPADKDANFRTGRTNYDEGWNDPNHKSGESRRFLLEKVGEPSKRKVALYWEMVPIDTEKTRVYDPKTKKTKPLNLKGTKEEMGRLGQRFTESDQAAVAGARAFAAEDIDPLEAGEADQPRQLRTRSGKRPAQGNDGGYKPGDKVSVYFPKNKKSYKGVVERVASKSIEVYFEEDDSTTTVYSPYKFAKRRR